MYGGIDKGWCFRYSRLSYRRKFNRNLWFGPLFVSAFTASILFQGWSWTRTLLVILPVTVFLVIQLAYTYYKKRAECSTHTTGA